MFCHNNKAFLFACQKDAAGAALKKAALALANKKIGSSSTLKVAAQCGSGSATLATGTTSCHLFSTSWGISAIQTFLSIPLTKTNICTFDNCICPNILLISTVS